MNMKRVFSSQADEVGYDAETKELHVKFKNGKTAVYMDVPADVGVAVVDAPSIGTALHQLVKGKFAYGYKA